MKQYMRFIVAMGALLLIFLFFTPAASQADDSIYWPTGGWRGSTPESQGIDSDKLAEALLTMPQQGINIHSLLVIRNGEMIADAYFYPYDGQTVHDVASVTKSVMTTLIGIAADQGKLNLDDPMLSFFPERTIANLDALKEQITVLHLVSMSSGLDCTKEGGEPTLAEMQTTPDWVQFTLDRPVVWEPGTHFVYCSPGMHLLSAILQQAAGMTTLDFARQFLFEPLGIREGIWPVDPQGYNTGSGDLKLHPHDMAKLGYLWLNQGVWEGKQIVSRQWVEESVKPLMDTREGNYYGYGWWVETAETGGLPSYRADGRGGQYVLVVPVLNLIVVTTGGGFTLDDITPLLLATFADTSESLPSNPAGLARLESALAAVSQPPAPEPLADLPATASLISGQNYVFAPNPLEIETLGFEFTDSAEAIMHFTPAGSDHILSLPVGLDGVYRLFPGDYELPTGLRGYWADDQTFAFEYDEIANNSHVVLRLRFEGDQLIVESQEISGEGSARFEGSLQNP